MCTTSMLLANVSVFASPDAAKTSLLPAKSDVASVAIVAQQGKTITGVVMDSQESIIGANVMVKGTTNGTITDFEGKFTLSNVPEGAILQISYIGYQSMEIKVGNQTSFTIKLKEDSQALDEVVVVGYGSQVLWELLMQKFCNHVPSLRLPVHCRGLYLTCRLRRVVVSRVPEQH